MNHHVPHYKQDKLRPKDPSILRAPGTVDLGYWNIQWDMIKVMQRAFYLNHIRADG